MSKSELSRMTVKELRELCGRHGLPKYQWAGKRLVKADLVAQLADTTEPTYRVAPVSELVTVSNGAMKWRETDHGDRVKSAGYVEYQVLRVIGTDDDPTEVRYADPVDSSRSWRSRYTARDTVARRLVRERQAQQAKSQGPAGSCGTGQDAACGGQSADARQPVGRRARGEGGGGGLTWDWPAAAGAR